MSGGFPTGVGSGREPASSRRQGARRNSLASVDTSQPRVRALLRSGMGAPYPAMPSRRAGPRSGRARDRLAESAGADQRDVVLPLRPQDLAERIGI
jgi:hypothetical protein